MSSEEDEYDTLIQADGFDLAIIGVAERIGMKPCIAYSYEQCVEILKQQTEMTEEEAIEFMDFNVCGAYVGEQTPIFIHAWEEYNA
jgi:hypothetical protein